MLSVPVKKVLTLLSESLSMSDLLDTRRRGVLAQSLGSGDAGVVLRGVEASIGVVISLQHHNNSVNCKLQKLLLRLSQKSRECLLYLGLGD